MNLRCMIVDDEPNAVNLLEVLIGQTTGWQLLAKCLNALDAISFLKNNSVDLIFLDIEMPLLSGMELAGLLSPDTAIVFATAYKEHAAESYSFNTIDYLLKPITLKRFIASTKKIENHFQNLLPAEKKEEEYFFVKTGSELHKIQLAEILYFESQKEYVKIVTQKREILTYRRLKDIEAQLNPPFTRVHNSFIVNIKQLSKIHASSIYIGQKQIPIGDKFRDELMAIIQKRTF
ncbi:MAG: response regulator transcription factor [Bacteroidetes bacterium]|nr:response regulator transcription factor [Bacteroidota bacterium]